MRSWSAGIQSILNALAWDQAAVLVDFDSLGLHYTNRPETIVSGSTTYTPAVMKLEHLGENLYAEAPATTLRLTSLDAAEQARFFEDSFRGETFTVRILVKSGGSWTATGFSMTLTGDADQATADEVTIRLSSSDFVEGTQVPRRSTQETGCQHNYQTGGCPYRGRLTGCDKGLLTPNGCRAHFLDLCLETGLPWVTADATAGRTKVRQPLPYGAFFGGLTHRLVTP